MRNVEILVISILSLCFLFLIFADNPVYAQTTYHNVGKFSDKWDWYLGQYNYPNGFYQSGITSGHKFLNVIKGYTNDIGEVTSERDNIGTGANLYIKGLRRFNPPSIIVDRVNVTPPFMGKVDNSIPSDVYTETKSAGPISRLEKTYSFANRNHDDYVIKDITIAFTGDNDEILGPNIPSQTVEFACCEFIRCYISTLANDRASYCGDMKDCYNKQLGWATYDWYTQYTGKQLLASGAPRDDLIISYYYGGNDGVNLVYPKGYNKDDVNGKLYNSIGFPDIKKGWPGKGIFIAPQYTGFTTLYADKTANDATDDPTQPNNVTWLTHRQEWDNQWPGLSNWYFLTEKGWNLKEGYIEYSTDPTFLGDTNHIPKQSYGPFTLNLDSASWTYSDFRFVYALGCGMIDEDICYSEGLKWYNWYWDLNVPDDQKLDDAGKEAIISTGKDSLFQAMDRAYLAFRNGYDVPDPPPAPDIEVNGGPDQIEISWSYPNDNLYKDPDTGSDDFAKWRLYRKRGSYYVYDNQDQGLYLKYELIAELDKNTTSYIDKTITRGVQYHYCVTGVDDGSQNKDGINPGEKLEGSYYANRTPVGATSFKPGMNESDQVVVVPNPYSVSTGLANAMNWPGAVNEIRFMNLPAYCTMKIYTSTGDLVKTIEHINGSADEAWQNLRTDNNQYPVSGVYILAINDAQDVNKEPLPKQFVKFVIVR